MLFSLFLGSFQALLFKCNWHPAHRGTAHESRRAELEHEQSTLIHRSFRFTFVNLQFLFHLITSLVD